MTRTSKPDAAPVAIVEMELGRPCRRSGSATVRSRSWCRRATPEPVDPAAIRRWIREGKLRSTKVGTQHVVEERDLDALLDDGPATLPIPAE